MNDARTDRPGVAAAALLLILVITVAWWMLALWPTGSATPEWLARTRAACFGSTGSGLPDTSGWILLIGEPIGMLAALALIWGKALRRDLRRIRESPTWRRVAVVVAVALLVGVTAAARRVAHATGITAPEMPVPRGVAAPVTLEAGAITLVDQHGRREAITGPALLTFAFGHCGAICPTLVHQVRAARAEARREDIPLLILTLDPWRDTPTRLATLARQWELGAHDRVLSGTIDEVNTALDHLRVSRQRDRSTGDIDHVAVVMVLDAGGTVVHRLEGGWGGVAELLDHVPDSLHQQVP
ncbi:MAG: SCO family protein [Gemmatimonadetes bacterium]|mgnify:CR=1 FL=1|nr:SCO family protein [Gemmatimonadota bacterium]MCA9763820.1 SCO family protein [Gemmatimonadota bacterium]MCA9768756.1 SCO family protein [Gemmatimonadota bacterium]MCB9517990.1 SCO family protein [Gemmatimonadales bacterium]HPE12615.1 SCO family protein [Actinomycetota bacterium]